MSVETLRIYPDRELPEVYFLAGSPAEAIARASVAARQFPVAAQGAGNQPGETAANGRSSLNCAGAVSAVPAAFSGEGA